MEGRGKKKKKKNSLVRSVPFGSDNNEEDCGMNVSFLNRMTNDYYNGDDHDDDDDCIGY